MDHKAILHRYLQTGREVLLWKLDGLSDYDARRPITTSGTNLLGIVKHVASVEIDYFTRVFDRPCPVDLPWFAPDAPTNSDMWATPQESRDFIVSLYHTSWRVSDSTINQLDLDARGHVPWWREDRRSVTLQQILVHMIAETHRHAGHADVVREFIDGVRGWKDDALNLPPFDASHWHGHIQEIEQAARSFRVTTSDS